MLFYTHLSIDLLTIIIIMNYFYFFFGQLNSQIFIFSCKIITFSEIWTLISNIYLNFVFLCFFFFCLLFEKEMQFYAIHINLVQRWMKIILKPIWHTYYHKKNITIFRFKLFSFVFVWLNRKNKRPINHWNLFSYK